MKHATSHGILTLYGAARTPTFRSVRRYYVMQHVKTYRYAKYGDCPNQRGTRHINYATLFDFRPTPPSNQWKVVRVCLAEFVSRNLFTTAKREPT